MPQEDDALPCRACDRTLKAEMRDLIPVLTSASAAVEGVVDLHAIIEPVRREPAPACPDCDGGLVRMPGEVLGAMTATVVRRARAGWGM